MVDGCCVGKKGRSYTLRLAKALKLLPDSDTKRLEQLRRRASGLTWKLYSSMGT